MIEYFDFSPLANQASTLNVSRVQVPYTFESNKILTSSPTEYTEKKLNPPTNFINDANSRLLNSRQLNLNSEQSNCVTSKPEDNINVPYSYSSGIHSKNPQTGSIFRHQKQISLNDFNYHHMALIFVKTLYYSNKR